MKRIYPILFLIVLITACAPDPRKGAQAFEITTNAQQEALNSEQARQHNEQLNAIQLQELQLKQQQLEATSQQRIAAWKRLLKWGSKALTAGVMVFVITLALSLSYGSLGIAKAKVRAAEVQANLIRLDPVTRQFPALLQYVGKGKFTLTNMNVNATLALDTRNEADRQMIATAGATQIAGVMTQEAAKSADPAGVAIVRPTVINARDETIEIGEFWRQDA